jgi:hypothetical protein
MEKKPNPARELARSLAGKIAKMSDAERLELAARVPITTIDGRTLSLKNMILVGMQRPDATMVGGFRQWIGAGRCVKAGEHAAWLWVPSTRKIEGDGETEGADTGETETRFLLAPVFDVAQTQEIDATAAIAA